MIRLMITVFAALTAVAPSANDISQHPNDMACLNCHSEQLLGSQRHFSKETGDCAFCHQLSVSENGSRVMLTYGESTCHGCHESTVEFTGSGQHDAIGCSSCHDPHSSDNDFLLVEEPIGLCSNSCHGRDQLGRSHPVGGSVLDANTGDRMTCTSTCHRLHKPEFGDLLLAESSELCRNCHCEKF
jgi:predicted CXXCH cytochrome family protein